MILTPIAGMLSDRLEPARMAMAACAAGLVASYPLLASAAASPGLEGLLVFQITLAICTAVYGGSVAVVMAQLFPPHMRSTGVAIGYSLGVAVFGGFAPVINAWLIAVSGSNLAPAWYLCFAAAMSIIALIAADRLLSQPATAR
jgi:MHS family proline/betaine transporter-like MFS transporter